MQTVMKKTAVCLIGIGLSAAVNTPTAFAVTQVSAQRHGGAVTALASDTQAFFSAGDDGFLVRWTGAGVGEHYQVSELAIALIAVHQNGTDIAVYETDGFALHRVSVWDWKTQRRKFAKRFQTSITALSFTQKGSYLMVATTSVDGVIFLDDDGEQINKLKDATGIVSLVKSSDTEASCVMYAPSGSLIYYDLKTGNRKTEIRTEPSLTQTVLYNNNVFLAGVRGNTVFVILATTGKVLLKESARSPLLFTAGTELYYTETTATGIVVKTIPTGARADTQSVSTAVEYRRFSLPKRETFTAAHIGNDTIAFGTQSGNVYAIGAGNTNTTALASYSADTFVPIADIAPAKDGFFFITDSGIYYTAVDDTYDGARPIRVADNAEHNTDMLAADALGGVITWARGVKRAVTFIATDSAGVTSGARRTLFNPTQKVRSVRLFGDSLIIIENNTTVSRYDFVAGKTTTLYTGTGIQDALLYRDGELLIAKTQASNPRSPLISVNTATKETAPLPLTGEIAYALTMTATGAAVYGITTDVTANERKTQVFVYDTVRRNASTVFQLADEDTDAFAVFADTTLYTNIGRTQITAYDIASRRQTRLERGAALPRKFAQSGGYRAVLNADGTASWYMGADTAIKGNLCLTLAGYWREY